MFILGEAGDTGLKGVKGQYSFVNLTEFESIKLVFYILCAVS